MFNQRRQTIQNYIASIAVVIFGLWLLSEKPVYQKSDLISYQDNSSPYSGSSVALGAREQATTRDDITNPSGSVVVTNESNKIMNHTEITDSRISAGSTEAESASVSDDAWFSGVMQKARNIKDRIINIDIAGGTGNGATSVSGVTQNNDINDENSLLPQPTETESLVDNTVDCASQMYMGGNAYGRNMLIKMGCPVP